MRRKSYDIAGPRQILRFLRAEIADLEATPPLDSDSRTRRALTCASLAWSLGDWIFSALTEAQQKKLAIEWGYPVQTLADLQNYLRHQSRDFYLCRRLATEAMHGAVRRYNDPAVQRTPSPTLADPEPFRGGGFRIPQPKDPKGGEDSGPTEVAEVFYGAAAFAQKLMDRLGIVEQ